MKFIHALSFCVFALVLVSSCKKGDTGPAGPAGAEGPQGSAGAQGPQGPAGTANVIYSSWMADSAIIWKDSSVLMKDSVNGAPYHQPNKVARFTVKDLTRSILDSGVVLVYGKFYIDSSIHQLPYTMYTGTYTRFDLYDTKVDTGSISVFHARTQNGGWVVPNFNNNTRTATFRYILIPGGMQATSGRFASGPLTGYTKQQLASLTYAQAASLFNLPEWGSNIK